MSASVRPSRQWRYASHVRFCITYPTDAGSADRFARYHRPFAQPGICRLPIWHLNEFILERASSKLNQTPCPASRFALHRALPGPPRSCRVFISDNQSKSMIQHLHTRRPGCYVRCSTIFFKKYYLLKLMSVSATRLNQLLLDVSIFITELAVRSKTEKPNLWHPSWMSPPSRHSRILTENWTCEIRAGWAHQHATLEY